MSGTDGDEEPGTWDFRVRVTHVDRDAARELVTGNALDDPFGTVTVEEVLGPGEFDIDLIDIPFNEWSLSRMADGGDKRATTRTEKYGEPGDQFLAAGRLWELTHVVEVPLGIVADYFWEVEGAEDRAEFVEVWNDIHYRRGYDAAQMVWLHLFRVVGNT